MIFIFYISPAKMRIFVCLSVCHIFRLVLIGTP